MLTAITPMSTDEVPARQVMLPAEADFYSDYEWCLDPHLTIREVTDHLRGEIDRLNIAPEDWRIGEVATNVFLLSCALQNSVDEYLRGPTLRMPRQLAARRLGRGVRWMAEKTAGRFRQRGRTQVRRWKKHWQTGLDDFLAAFASGTTDRAALVRMGGRLAKSLEAPLPSDLQAEHIGVPSAFGRLDVTHFDILTLGRRFAERFPDRSRPILVLGVRTGGTYFAALLRAFFKAEGYRTVSSLTVHVNKGAGHPERRELKRYASQQYTAVIVDDPPSTGSAVMLAFDIACSAGFSSDKVVVLVPTDPARRDWFKSLPIRILVALEPEQGRKHQLFEPGAVESRLAEYYPPPDFTDVTVVASRRADDLNARLQSGMRGARLKRIYEVRLRLARGQMETRYILAKSVGWGWLGYHAFLAGRRLSEFVPPILGLRDGILYTEWIPQPSLANGGRSTRDSWIDTSASYVAARARALRLPEIKTGGKALQQHENGLRLLERVLSKAYGRFPIDLLMWSRVRTRLRQLPCPYPTLVDAKMGRAEWIVGASGLLKTDFEHHGMGKAELNVRDPAYDLAETVLSLALSPEEEDKLVRRYARASGDNHIEQRLFMSKLLAGFWAMEMAQDHLFSEPETVEGQQEIHQRFMSAWNFLTVHTARFCGSYCRPQKELRWRSPLLALDIDGVLDRRIFGYPCTTAAGMEALSLLSARGISVGLNTARSIAEVKDYCHAYGLAGGVAEHGGCLWDAVAQREQVLISPEAMRQLEELRRQMRRLPGVFLDDRHRFSIRAFTYDDEPRSLLSRMLRSARSFSVGRGTPIPLPTLVMNHLMTALRLDRLSFHHTMIDTTIVAKDINKGTGLLALRDWILGADAETIAVGDSEADLPMFRVATRSYAPAQIGCAREARLLGCQISRYRYQRGLLDIARTLARPERRLGERWTEEAAIESDPECLFLELLQAADGMRVGNLIGALFDPANLRTFVR
jgi:hydroxymethylpyrimidine pyrophosphatase-like HAD family hydrolase